MHWNMRLNQIGPTRVCVRYRRIRNLSVSGIEGERERERENGEQS